MQGMMWWAPREEQGRRRPPAPYRHVYKPGWRVRSSRVASTPCSYFKRRTPARLPPQIMAATFSCTVALRPSPRCRLGAIGAVRPVRAPMPAVRPLPQQRRRAAAAAARAVAGQQGMTLEAFNKLISSSPAVLVDFYTTW